MNIYLRISSKSEAKPGGVAGGCGIGTGGGIVLMV